MTAIRNYREPGHAWHQRDPAEAVAVRQLWPHDRAILAAHLNRLDAESRRARFGGAVGTPFLARYAGETLEADGFVKAAFVDGVCRGVGEARFIAHRDYDVEAAFSIEHGWQNKGLGDMLFKRVVRAAANRGKRRLCMVCLRSNLRMIRLASNNRARIRLAPDGVIGEIVDGGGSLFALSTELLMENVAFLMTVPVWALGGETGEDERDLSA